MAFLYSAQATPMRLNIIWQCVRCHAHEMSRLITFLKVIARGRRLSEKPALE